MVNFFKRSSINIQKKDEEKKKDILDTKFYLGQEVKEEDTTSLEADVAMTKEIVEEEKAFRRGVLSVRDLIDPKY
jgi:hypothetical protein